MSTAAGRQYRGGVKDIRLKHLGSKAKGAVRKQARVVRKPSRAKRLLPWRFRLLLGAGGLVLVLVGFLLRRRL